MYVLAVVHYWGVVELGSPGKLWAPVPLSEEVPPHRGSQHRSFGAQTVINAKLFGVPAWE